MLVNAEIETGLHNEELGSSYQSPNIVRVIKSRKFRWTCHVAMDEGRSAFKMLTGKTYRKETLRKSQGNRCQLRGGGWSVG